MPIKVKIKNHIDVHGNRVPQYMRDKEFTVIHYPDEDRTTIMFDEQHVYTFRNIDIIKV